MNPIVQLQAMGFGSVLVPEDHSQLSSILYAVGSAQACRIACLRDMLTQSLGSCDTRRFHSRPIQAEIGSQGPSQEPVQGLNSLVDA